MKQLLTVGLFCWALVSALSGAAQCTNGYGLTIVGSYSKNGGASQSLANGSSSSVTTGTYVVTLTALTKQSYSPTQATFAPWTFGDSGGQGAYNSNNNTQGTITLRQLYAGVSVTASATNSCGESASFSFRLYASSNGRLAASPNPASGDITIHMEPLDDMAPGAATTLLPAKPLADLAPVTAYLYNNQGALVRTMAVPAGQTAGTIQVQDLPSGIYLLKTSADKQAAGQRIQVLH